MLPFLAYTTPLWARNALRMRYLMLPARPQARVPAQRGRRALPVADDQRRRGIRVLRRRHRAVPHQRRRQLRAREVRARDRRRRVPLPRGRRHRRRDGAAVDDPRLLAHERRGATASETFHIHGVTGPDEYTTVVNDNLFTNVMARFNLRFAARTVREMADVDARGVPPDGRPPRASIPASPRRGSGPPRRCTSRTARRSASIRRITCSSSARSGTSRTRRADKRPLLLHFHPLVIYRYQVLKQADVVLALFLQGNHFTRRGEARRLRVLRPADHGRLDAVGGRAVDPRGRGRLPGPRAGVLPAVDVRRPRRPAPQRGRRRARRVRRRGVDRARRRASAACATTSASCRSTRACPPTGTSSRSRCTGTARAWPSRSPATSCASRPTRATPSTSSVRGVGYVVGAGEEVVVPLDGPGAASSPGARRCAQFDDVRREDGTLLSASVPTVTTSIPIIEGTCGLEHGADRTSERGRRRHVAMSRATP